MRFEARPETTKHWLKLRLKCHHAIPDQDGKLVCVYYHEATGWCEPKNCPKALAIAEANNKTEKTRAVENEKA